jgi:hypothetical protein
MSLREIRQLIDMDELATGQNGAAEPLPGTRAYFIWISVEASLQVLNKTCGSIQFVLFWLPAVGAFVNLGNTASIIKITSHDQLA